jgi:hypothetical protein
MSLRRPSPRRLGVALALLGVLAGVAFLLVPVEAAFAKDPLLRLQPFGGASARATSGVDCGSPVTNFRRRGDGLSLYALAEDRACRDASARRAAAGVATAGVIGLLGAICLTGARDREGVPA